MKAIVYVSAATRLYEDDELEALLIRSRSRNLREGITGLLLYAEGTFMQHLEGAEAPLQRVYDDIRADSRHHALIEVIHQTVQFREFSEWSMAYTRVSAEQMRALSSSGPDAVRLPNPGPGEYILRRFWERQRPRP